MDRHMMVKELAQQIGVVPETIINWEKRNLKPTRRHWGTVASSTGTEWGSGGIKPRRSSEPELTVKASILDGLGDVFREDLIRRSQVRNRSGNFQNLRVRPRR